MLQPQMGEGGHVSVVGITAGMLILNNVSHLQFGRSHGGCFLVISANTSCGHTVALGRARAYSALFPRSEDQTCRAVAPGRQLGLRFAVAPCLLGFHSRSHSCKGPCGPAGSSTARGRGGRGWAAGPLPWPSLFCSPGGLLGTLRVGALPAGPGPALRA